jgi:hypothetical protein
MKVVCDQQLRVRDPRPTGMWGTPTVSGTRLVRPTGMWGTPVVSGTRLVRPTGMWGTPVVSGTRLVRPATKRCTSSSSQATCRAGRCSTRSHHLHLHHLYHHGPALIRSHPRLVFCWSARYSPCLAHVRVRVPTSRRRHRLLALKFRLDA